eukprot:TRINITY_DN66894_c3_g1_i1.p1 TRINITY_DN66894_c3_g1~~TRINITY_DN66894_c3_g1_i1.p1  ORF type:complete len:519 (-),score=32.31 TRINITY_DN66894_c3_g1_i1:147-1703(-)
MIFLFLLLCAAQARRLVDSSLELNEIIWQPEKTEIYIGSPSIARNPETGVLVASADRFGHGAHPGNVSIFHSHDNGLNWKLTVWVVGNYWANLHYNDTTKVLWLLGGMKDIRIASSKDFGFTWSSSTLFPAPTGHVFNTGPTPMLYANGKVWRGIEYSQSHVVWPLTYEAMLIYADQKSDLMSPSSWKRTPPVKFQRSWIPHDWTPQPSFPGYLEGNAVQAPDNQVYEFLRFNTRPYAGNYAVALKVSPSSSPTMSFHSIVKLPGGHTKFVIRRDSVSGLYYTLSNYNHDPKWQDQRNILVLCVSEDLFNWHILTTLLMDDTGVPLQISVDYTGFHYVDWKFVGSSIYYVIRTGYRGSNSYHNSNRMTFKIIENFRDYKVPQRAKLATVTGHGWNNAVLANGNKIFSNRDYTWKLVDTRITGLNVTQLPGGASNHTSIAINIKVETGGVLYIAATPPTYYAMGGDSEKGTSWMFTNYAMQYTDEHSTFINVYAMAVQPGQELSIPQHNCGWAGCMLLW